MYKRFLCVLLAVLLLLGLMPMMALHSEAVSKMTTSEECIEILKDMEGFVKMPMKDHGQYSIGYGSRCNPEDYPNGITKEEADELLREFLEDMEKSVNAFAAKYGIVFAQHQFDALMLFTYNCGTTWMDNQGSFRSAVIEGRTGNDFLGPITLWTSASSQLHLGLVERRLIEADMYLNGSYKNKIPSNYTYVVYDHNGGEAEARAQGYDCNLNSVVTAEPTRQGYRFLGWYTAAEGGNWITQLGSANAKQTLVAHWQQGSGNPQEGTPASYTLSADRLASLDFRVVPSGTVKGKLNASAMVNIVADFVDSNGVKWGKLMNGCWVNLGSPLTGVTSQENDELSISVTVKGDVVNIRSGPGTSYKTVGVVVQGDKLEIREIRQVGAEQWGRFRAGWIRLDFTTYEGGSEIPQPQPPKEEEVEDEDREGIPGTVTSNSGLNIRSGPGTNYGVVGAYGSGDRVYILEQKTVSGVNWGRTDRGWISLQYVKLQGTEQAPEEKPTEPEEKPTEPTVPPTEPEEKPTEPTVPPTEPEEKPTEPEKNPEDSKHEGTPGTVVSNAELNIRSAPGTNNPRVGAYKPGTRIYILEQKTAGGLTWGRTDKGWVCMQYVSLEYTNTSGEGVQGTVISNSPLNVRTGAGVYNAKVATYIPGTRITIYETTTVAGQKWGRTDKGWVCMIYVVLDSQLPPAPGTQPEQPETGKPETDKPAEEKPEQGTTGATGTVTATGLNIRSGAGTHNPIVDYYRRGDKVTILEQKVVSGVYWGRTDKGWISLAHVKMDSTGGNVPAGFSGTVTATALNIRKGPGTGNAHVGTYYRGDKVTILETTKVGATTWGRTDKGWICMDYVK